MKISEIDVQALNQIARNHTHVILLIDNLGVVCKTISFYDKVEFEPTCVTVNGKLIMFAEEELEKIQVIYRTVNLS